MIQKMLVTASGPMHALFDMYKVDLGGSAMWLGSVQSYSVALFEIKLTAARAPGDYAIVNRQTGDRTALSFGLSVDGHHDHVNPVTAGDSVRCSAKQVRAEAPTSHRVESEFLCYSLRWLLRLD